MRVIRGKKEIGCQVGGGLLKFQSLGEIFLLPDGTAMLMPVEVIPLEDGQIVLRIGQTTYWFEKDGSYGGAEIKSVCSDPLYEESVVKLLEKALRNRGREPEPYFTLPGETR